MLRSGSAPFEHCREILGVGLVAVIVTFLSVSALAGKPSLHGCSAFNGSVNANRANSVQTPLADGFRPGETISLVVTVRNRMERRTFWVLELRVAGVTETRRFSVDEGTTHIFGPSKLAVHNAPAAAVGALYSSQIGAEGDLTMHFGCSKRQQLG